MDGALRLIAPLPPLQPRQSQSSPPQDTHDSSHPNAAPFHTPVSSASTSTSACSSPPHDVQRSLTSPFSFRSSSSRWLAITHRVPSSHSAFLYGVKSTKIYCRPTCTARVARRANVVYYGSQDEARRDGFRPCKRCRPDDETFVGDREEMVEKVLTLLRTQEMASTGKGGLKELAKQAGVTPSYLCRVFKSVMGTTLGAYISTFECQAKRDETQMALDSYSESSKSRCGSASIGAGESTSPLTAVASVQNPFSPNTDDFDHWPVDGQSAQFQDMLDLDLDVDFEEWIWTADFPPPSNCK